LAQAVLVQAIAVPGYSPPRGTAVFHLSCIQKMACAIGMGLVDAVRASRSSDVNGHSSHKLCHAILDTAESADNSHGAIQWYLRAARERLEPIIPEMASCADSHGNAYSHSFCDDEEQRWHASRDMVLEMLANDLPVQLLARIDSIDFEAQKEAIRLFGAALQHAPRLELKQRMVDYLQDRQQMSEVLLGGCGKPEIALHCGLLLRSCARYAELAEFLLDARGAFRLMHLVRHPSFDIASDAFACLRELLLMQRDVAAKYVQAHFDEFFTHFNGLLQIDDYVVQRQASNLLGEMLLSPDFAQIMFVYVSDHRYLQVHMNLLRNEARTLQLNAFHVFKLFVANPHKQPQVERILCRNRERLVKLLETFQAVKREDDSFLADLWSVVDILESLPPMVRS